MAGSCPLLCFQWDGGESLGVQGWSVRFEGAKNPPAPVLHVMMRYSEAAASLAPARAFSPSSSPSQLAQYKGCRFR